MRRDMLRYLPIGIPVKLIPRGKTYITKGYDRSKKYPYLHIMLECDGKTKTVSIDTSDTGRIRQVTIN
jgi:hypothetical protein